jgi:hypothetical protein
MYRKYFLNIISLQKKIPLITGAQIRIKITADQQS